MHLRPYQIEAIDRVRLAMTAGRRRVVLVMPTGAGKTRTCAEMVARAVAGGRRALWLAHRSELVDQSAATLTSLGLTVGGACASAATPPNPYAPVQVASVQTLIARNVRPPADLIVADEAHHFCDAAESFATLLRSYPDARVVGATATPERGDGCGLSGCFDALVVGASIGELTASGHLVPCQVLRPDRPLGPAQIAENPVDAYVANAAGRRAILFARSVALAEQYAQEFCMRGITARSVNNETPAAERRLYIDTFRLGKIQVLTNVMVCTEGFDAPEMSCVILARGCGSAGMYLQIVGRALRPAPGKTDALLIDLRGVSHEHGRPEDEREYSLDGRGIRLRDANSYCPVCGAPRTPPDPCEACGYAPSGEDGTKPDRVTGDKLVPYAYKRSETDEQKFATLLRWMRVAQAKGYRRGWVQAKWRAVYAEALPSAEYRRAELALEGRRGAVA